MAEMNKEEARMRRRLVEDFLIPALDSGKYGGKLFWRKKEECIFRIFWSHKNAAKWSKEDTIVFQEWDRLKGHYKPEGKNYFMCAKQRFRAALYKLSPSVRSITCPDKSYRDYQLIIGGKKKLCENLARSKTKVTKRTIQSAIPTSVIRENTSYIAKSVSENEKEITPSPERQYAKKEQVFAQYKCSVSKMKKKEMIRQFGNQNFEENIQRSPREVHETSVLRENSSTPRIPHISPQPVPVYSYKHLYIRSHNVQECPQVFVSRIYNEPENVPQAKDEPQSYGYTTDDDTSGILNLSVKSDSSNDAPSR